MNKLEKSVGEIIARVRRGGDRALVAFTKQFDRVQLDPKKLRVAAWEYDHAIRRAGLEFIELFCNVAKNIEEYHRLQLPSDCSFKNAHGARVGWIFKPVERVGIYIPGGTAPLISTVLMTVIPAQVAGVSEIVVCTPPQKNGRVNPHILAACSLRKVKAVYRVGGAQAVAAMAYGTKSVPQVDLIAGPGNAYVTEAKRQLYGVTGIDMTAGPSEVAIIADKSANPEYIAADLLSQAEHDPRSRAALFSSTASLLEKVRAEITRQVASLPRKAIIARAAKRGITLVKCKSLVDAIKRVNELAPEHLEIVTRAPQAVASSITNAGAIFVGPNSATALGDYVAGPSHVLPTGGAARFSSVLSVDTFLKRVGYIHYGKRALAKAASQVEALARLEGLEAHARAVHLRRGKGK